MMTTNLITVQTGGKLYIAGEYAVLTPGQTALIKHIPIYMTASIQESETISILSDMFDYAVDLSPDKNYALIQESIRTFKTYIGKDIPNFKLGITGKLERDGLKFGIGSSGSIAVLTIKALATFTKTTVSADTLFKLASYTLLKLGDNGSMGDIACIVYGELVAYRSFDREKIADLITRVALRTLLEHDWGYQIDVIKPNITAEFLVGWTRQPAISKDMINQVKLAITPEFLSETEKEVGVCKTALLTGDKVLVKSSLDAVSQLLENLHPAIYSESLKTLKAAESRLDVITKSSGSGGGDCGIAYSFSKEDSNKLIERWQKAGIEVLYQERGL